MNFDAILLGSALSECSAQSKSRKNICKYTITNPFEDSAVTGQQVSVAVPKRGNSEVSYWKPLLTCCRELPKTYPLRWPQIADSIGANFGNIATHKHISVGNYGKCASPAVRCHLPPDFLQRRSRPVGPDLFRSSKTDRSDQEPEGEADDAPGSSSR